MLLRAKSFFRKNRIFSVVCLFELLLILLLTVHSIVTPISTLTISPVNFMLNDSSNVRFEDNQLFFTEGAEVTIDSTSFPLGFGAYEAVVTYSSSAAQSDPAQSYGATIGFSAEHQIETDHVRLYDGRTSVTSRVWIPFLKSCHSFRAALVYHGVGDFSLKSIHLTESIPYRLCRTLGFALVLLLIDLLYWLFFSSSFVLTRSHIYGLILVAIGLTASLPFFSDLLFEGHDLIFHLNRISSIADGFRNGQFPVRLYTAQNNGYGYAAPLFYCDIFLYFPALLYNCLLPARTCYQIYAICVNLITIFLTYFCFKKIIHEKQLALIAAILYSLCTYRLSNIFARAAVGEYTAMTFLPLIVLGIYRIYTNEKPGWRSWLPLSLGVSGVLMSHVITTELVLFNLIIVCLVLAKKTFKPIRLLALVKAAVLCLLLTIWFWLPFLEEFLTETIKVQHADNNMRASALFLVEVVSIFSKGAGLNMLNSMRDAMPLTIGMSLVVGLMLIFFCVLARSYWKEKSSLPAIQLILFLVILNILFTLRLFPWNYLSIFSNIQFPWRFLIIASILIPVGILLALSLIRSHYKKAFHCCLVILTVSVFISTGSILYEHSHGSKEDPYSVMPSHTIGDDLYLPLESNQSIIYTQPFPFSNDGVLITNFARNGHQTQFNAFNPSETSASVIAPLYFYNHYQATDDSGTGIPVSRSTDGRVQLTLPAHYEGSLSVSHVPPIHWHVAEAVSAASWLALAVFALKNRKKV